MLILDVQLSRKSTSMTKSGHLGTSEAILCCISRLDLLFGFSLLFSMLLCVFKLFLRADPTVLPANSLLSLRSCGNGQTPWLLLR
jgi:hypothetical protein